jgi:hypothetical protein
MPVSTTQGSLWREGAIHCAGGSGPASFERAAPGETLSLELRTADFLARSAPFQGAEGRGAEMVAATDSAQARSPASSKAMVTMHRPSSFATLACRM